MNVKITLFANINTDQCSLDELVNQAADYCYDYDVEPMSKKDLDELGIEVK